MSGRLQWSRNSSAALAALLFVFLVNLCVAQFSQVPAGGQDSWNHYLYARWAPAHPSLLLDQWGKPFFTLIALPFARFGMEGVLCLNHFCVLATAWVAYLTCRKMGLKNPWMAIFLFAFQPVVLANVHSALTEPSNALVLTVVCYLFASSRWVLATSIASFLPLVRSEGFVLLIGIIFFLALRNRWKLIPLMFGGTMLYAIMGALVSGQWNWILLNNPYVHQELNNGFDAGHGVFWHYFSHQGEITGFLVTALCLISLFLVLGYIVKRFKKLTPANVNQMALWLWWPLFGLFFLVHSVLWWKGVMGSHGLLRVFVVVSPVAALLAMHTIDKLMRLEIKSLNRLVKGLVTAGMFFLAFPGAGFPYPWNMNRENVGERLISKVQINEALAYFQKSKYNKAILAHQIPSINVFQNYDPWAAGDQLHPVDENGNWTESKEVSEWPQQSKTLSLWSLDVKDSGVNDWFPMGTVVLWDNFHGRRDANISRSQLYQLKKYRVLKEIATHDQDSLNDVVLLVKVLP